MHCNLKMPNDAPVLVPDDAHDKFKVAQPNV